MASSLEEFAFDQYPNEAILDSELRECWAVIEKLLPQAKRYFFSLIQLIDDLEDSREEGYREDWGRLLEYGTFEIGVRNRRFMAVFAREEHYCSPDTMLEFLKGLVEDWKDSA